jgi:hypothetical protein
MFGEEARERHHAAWSDQRGVIRDDTGEDNDKNRPDATEQQPARKQKGFVTAKAKEGPGATPGVRQMPDRGGSGNWTRGVNGANGPPSMAATKGWW